MWFITPKNKKLVLKSQLQTYQILTNDDQIFILCLSYFITTVMAISKLKTNFMRIYLQYSANLFLNTANE